MAIKEMTFIRANDRGDMIVKHMATLKSKRVGLWSKRVPTNHRQVIYKEEWCLL
jgi:Txe/YoeB family toxin of Txe-Axe toxin-antitoxin module